MKKKVIILLILLALPIVAAIAATNFDNERTEERIETEQSAQ